MAYSDWIERPLEPKEPRCIAKCPFCGEDICEGEDIITFEADIYHEDCFADKAMCILTERYGARIGVAGYEM